jgi:hypothetical protein
MGSFDGVEHLFSVALGFYLGEDFEQLLIGPDEEGGALNPHDFLAIHVLFLENIKLFAHYFVYICKEGVGQAVFFFEFFLRLGRVAGNAQNDGAGLLYLLEYITKAAGFDGAARSVGPGVEEKHHRLAGIVLQVYGFVFFSLKGKIGNFVVHLHETSPSPKEIAMQRDYSMITKGAHILLMLTAVVAPAGAQYPGHMENNAKKAAPTIRAVAVVEWTGDKAKPSASRIIPISVFDGEQYQPGGLYLAKPEPLALEPGTEYVVEDAGVARSLFDVNNAQDVDGYWFGYGAWRSMAPPPKKAKPKQGKNMPQVVNDSGNGRPHFKGRDSSGNSSSTDSSSSSGSGTSTGSSNPPAGDPDRPTLRRRSEPSTSSSTDSVRNADNSPPETPIGGADPDRPHMAHGQQTPVDEYQAPQLTGVPPGLQQMIAVSDVTDHEAHPFVYLWSDPADAAKMKEQMETAAAAAIAAAAPPAKTPPKPRTHTTTTATATQRRRTTTAPPPAPKPVFTNEQFKAYELTYSAGATLVFSGETQDKAGKTTYVTLIAQPDFNDVPKVIFKSVTDDAHLDVTPKMRLVDAVDARANNRGDLVFELRRNRDREFVIYRVTAGQTEQVFTTGSLSNSQSSPGQ